MQGQNICKRPIICKGGIYAKTYNMQRPIICEGKIYAKTYNMQGENMCKDL